LYGETIQQINDDPVASQRSEREKAVAAGLSTVPQAALEALIPASIVSGGARRLARNVAPSARPIARGAGVLGIGSVIEGGTELGQEAIQQTTTRALNPEAGYDRGDLTQAFLAGTAGGMGFNASSAIREASAPSPAATDTDPVARF